MGAETLCNSVLPLPASCPSPAIKSPTRQQSVVEQRAAEYQSEAANAAPAGGEHRTQADVEGGFAGIQYPCLGESAELASHAAVEVADPHGGAGCHIDIVVLDRCQKIVPVAAAVPEAEALATRA